MRRLLTFAIFQFISITLILAQSSIEPFNFNKAAEARSILYQNIRLNDTYSIALDEGSYLGLGTNIWTRWGFRGSIKRHMPKHMAIDLGFMYNHISYKHKTTQEYRFHQSYYFSYPTMVHSAIKHRFRLEERIISVNGTDNSKIKSRLRYQISNKGSFRNKPISAQTFYYRLSAEWNFNIYNETDGKFLLRGRYGAGYGYRFNSALSSDLTYYFQHDAQAQTTHLNTSHIIQLALRYNFN